MYVATVVFAIVTALIVYMSLRVIGIGEAQLEVIKSYQLAYKPQYTKVYTHRDIVEMMANSCKIPYIFLDSSDVGDYHAYDFKSQCSKKKDELLVIQHMNGQIQLQDTANEFLGTEDFDCYYQKMGDEGTLTELTMFTNYTIPFARFEVICKNYDNIIYRKPFQNLALIIGDEEEPWENNTCSITTLHIPRMSYKIFSRTFTESNTFMKRNFLFFKLLFSGEQLGMETEDQANFKLRRFATENGYRVYENSDFAEYFDFLKENYKENVTDWEVEGCFEDGTSKYRRFLFSVELVKNRKQTGSDLE
ncbi:unnamed protein product [Caenorhabditis angaria]|uniref:Uncharacterized protein n=1 Tax=Caenorhabditis angaria TaxID=860376 RepID=A0A9P1N9S8_9PELO|nr:unnamed protein product [Caenorhabditis angaria]